MFTRDDYIVGIAAILIGIGIIVQAQFLEVRTSLDPAGPKALPVGIAVAMIVIGIIHIAGSYYVNRSIEPVGKTDVKSITERFREFRPVISIVIISLAYGGLLDIFGYLVMTPLLIGSILWVLEIRNIRKILKISLLMTTILYLVFRYGLQVDLPIGLFEYFS